MLAYLIHAPFAVHLERITGIFLTTGIVILERVMPFVQIKLVATSHHAQIQTKPMSSEGTSARGMQGFCDEVG